jgi:quinol monooxygenase YgiN
MYIATMSKVFLFVEIEVRPGQAEAFLSKLRSHLEVVRAENGCESIELYQNSENENLVHVWEVWSDRVLWDTHMGNEASEAWREIAADHVNGEKITVMHQA